MPTRLLRNTSGVAQDQNNIATFGSFDGLHKGHTALLERLIQARSESPFEQDSIKLIVLSFYPHPAIVLDKLKQVPLLTSLKQKLEILSEYEVDYFCLLRFSKELAEISAEEFIHNILFNKLRIRHLITGPDAALGHNAQGTPEAIGKIFQQAGRKYETIPAVQKTAQKISSRDIRQLLLEGKTEAAAGLLGRNYRLEVRVQPGQRIGQKLGFPTANSKLFKQLLPKSGIYATRCWIKGACFDSVTYIGKRPTFDGRDLVLESHVLNESGLNLYGRKMTIEFVSKLREDRAFPSVAELKKQIEEDVRICQKVLKRQSN